MYWLIRRFDQFAHPLCRDNVIGLYHGHVLLVTRDLCTGFHPKGPSVEHLENVEGLLLITSCHK